MGQTGKGKDYNLAPEDDPRFDMFVTAMSPEVTSLAVDELVEKYKAWKLLSRVHKDPMVLKAMVFKAGPSKGAAVPRVVNTDDNLALYQCTGRGVGFQARRPRASQGK